MGATMQNPFQSANLRELPWWRNVVLNDDKNPIFDELARDLEQAFVTAVDLGKLAPFAREYRRITRAMVQQLPDEPLVRSIVDRAFPRLVTIYSYLRQRRTSSAPWMAGDSSVVRWTLDERILAKAIDQADRMQEAGVTHQRFDLSSSPELRRWLLESYWPLVKQFCGIAALPITYAHLRCLNTERHGASYANRFRHHRFGNFHYDEDVYSLPLIIYLSDVSENAGPFEYLSASDKYKHNFTLRAFHQALNHDCDVSSLEEKSFAAIGRLPAVFRGGDVIGNLYPSAEFEEQGPMVVTGDAGTAVLFDGFNVIHSGGFPSNGCRKSLFANFRFPVAKVIPKARLLFLH